jgi:hypothetical protein
MSQTQRQPAPRYEVTPSKVWQHTSGRKVSPYGACPWMSDAGRKDWTLINQGWTLYDTKTNTYGQGRPPYKTQADAQAMADKWSTPHPGATQ